MRPAVPTLSLRGAAVTACVGAALACTSCGKGGLKLYPVQGKVLYLDKAAEGATVVFHPAGSSALATATPSGVVGADGGFSLHTHPHGEGAPAGEYHVLITWHPPNSREVENPVNKLPAKYSDHASPLIKVTVKEGVNQLEPFRLTK
jgi:hypothetical protein